MAVRRSSEPSRATARLVSQYDNFLDTVLNACKAHYGSRLVAVTVYGSVGRATPRADSDVDLLLVADDLPDGRIARVEEFRSIEDRLRPPPTSEFTPVWRRSSRPPGNCASEPRSCST